MNFELSDMQGLLQAILIFLAGAICWLMPDAISALVVAVIAAGLAFGLAYVVGRQQDRGRAPGAAPAAPASAAPAPLSPPPAPVTEDYNARLKTVRHDVRNALSPALLVADRLAMTEDADKKKAGDQISRAILRAVELLRQD